MTSVTLLLFAIGFIATGVVSLAARLSNGVSGQELIRTRFYEVVPVRGVIWILMGVVGGICLTTVCLFGQTLSGLHSQDRLWSAAALTLIPLLLLVALSGLICLVVWFGLVQLPHIETPEVDVGDASFRVGIAPQALVSLGAERFPNHVAPTRQADNLARWMIVVGAAFIIGILLYTNSQGTLVPNMDVAVQGFSRALLSSIPFAYDVAWFLGWTSALLMVMLLFNNRDYTFIPFRQTLMIQAALFVVCLLSIAVVSADGATAAEGLGILCGACGVRAVADLRSLWHYGKVKKVHDPIAENLKSNVPYLNKILEHPDFKLPALDRRALSRRISQGCRNVEERGIFVTRFFGRFMRLVEVEHEDFGVAMLRYLTVNRDVTLSGGVGTYAGFRYPKVPVWDLDLFPIRPPQGFVNWLDALTLGSEWDVVITCGRCGGRGQVQETYYETEYYTEYYTDSQGRSCSRQASRQVAKQRWVTCGTCSGSGRTLHHQILNTHWKCCIPRVTHPEIPMPELVENAEEVTFFRLPLTEHFESLPLRPETGGIHNQLVERMKESGERLAALHPRHADLVLSLTGGYLYRADFQVCGFRTIRILFQRLGGQVGWFFGKRPEFYFPRLPLCYGTIGTFLFLPPLAMALAAGMVQVVTEMLNWIR